MPLATEKGRIFETAREAAKFIAPRMARKLAEFHRDLLLQRFSAQPGGRAGPSNDTFALHDSARVVSVPNTKNAAQIDALFYWRYAMEFGSYLEIPSRRIDPPRLVSETAEETDKEKEKIMDTEITLFLHRVGFVR